MLRLVKVSSRQLLKRRGQFFCDSPPELNKVKFWKADGSMITLSSGPYMLVYTELTTVTLSLTIHSLSLEGTNV